MQRITLKTGPLPLVAAFVLIGGIFFMDLYVPEGVAIGMLYVAPVALIALWSPPGQPSLVIVAATTCTALTIIDLVYFSANAIAGVTLSNHTLALGSMWVVVILSLVRKRTEHKHRWIDLLPRF
jgi:hypothetical protein